MLWEPTPELCELDGSPNGLSQSQPKSGLTHNLRDNNGEGRPKLFQTLKILPKTKLELELSRETNIVGVANDREAIPELEAGQAIPLGRC